MNLKAKVNLKIGRKIYYKFDPSERYTIIRINDNGTVDIKCPQLTVLHVKLESLIRNGGNHE